MHLPVGATRAMPESSTPQTHRREFNRPGTTQAPTEHEIERPTAQVLLEGCRLGALFGQRFAFVVPAVACATTRPSSTPNRPEHTTQTPVAWPSSVVSLPSRGASSEPRQRPTSRMAWRTRTHSQKPVRARAARGSRVRGSQVLLKPLGFLSARFLASSRSRLICSLLACAFAYAPCTSETPHRDHPDRRRGLIRARAPQSVRHR